MLFWKLPPKLAGKSKVQHSSRQPDPETAQDLLEHERWVKSHPEGLSPVVFSTEALAGLDLNRRDLIRANLQDLDLHGTTFAEAQLSGAVLTGSDFSETVAQREARMGARHPVFRHADLSYADLRGTKGLTPGDLAGANLEGAQLPNELLSDQELKQVDQLARNAGGLSLSIQLACAFTWVTVGTTRDLALIMDSGTAKLPILNVDVPVVGFYFVVPFLLLAIYIYQHLSLLRLWEALSELPAVFPTGQSLDRKTYPWLINDFVTAYLPRLRHRRPAAALLQQGVTILLVWLLVPLTLALLWGRSVPRHDPPLSHVYTTLIPVSLAIGAGFLILARETFFGPYLPSRKAGLWRKTRALAITWLVVASTAAALVQISFGAFEASQRQQGYIEHVLGILGYRSAADLREVEITSRPDKWDGSTQGIKGASLRDQVDLRNADLFRAFLVNARLRGVDLRHATISLADLRGADLGPIISGTPPERAAAGSLLTGADLSRANIGRANLDRAVLRGATLAHAAGFSVSLRRADLRDADLRDANLLHANLLHANLRGANLERADLRGTDLRDAALRDADLRRADLQGANLGGADLRGADLQGADLRRADLQGADLRRADLRDADLRGVDLAHANLRGANLERADLRGTDLRDADLRGADLRRADLRGADLARADLRGADLRGADLARADLARADLGRADLRGANLRTALFSRIIIFGDSLGRITRFFYEPSLKGAKYNEFTRWPPRFQPAAKGAVLHHQMD